MLIHIFWLVFSALLYLLYLKRKKKFMIFKELAIPGPTPNIFFGNCLELYFKGYLQSHKEWITKYGKVVGYYLGTTAILLVTDTDLLKNIQIKDFQKFTDRPPITLLGNNPRTGPHLTNMKGLKWKQMRSVVTPSFTTSKMKTMSPIINEAIKRSLKIFEKLCESRETFESHALYRKLTLDVIIRIAFGLQTDIQENPKSRFYKICIFLISDPFTYFILFMTKSFTSAKPFFDYLHNLSGMVLNRGINPITELLNRCENIIDSRMKDSKEKKPDFLQLMINAEIQDNPSIDYQSLAVGDSVENKVDNAQEINNGISNFRSLTKAEILGNSFVFLLAGFETTSTALSFCTLMLANFPEVQEKIRKEVLALTEEEEELDYVSVQKLKYLDQVFKETLRLYPPVYLFVNRVATQNVQYGNLIIPKGVAIQVPVYWLHRDPDYWKNPEEFLPERFAPENSTKMNPLSWQAFGAGPRNCVGMRFAHMEAKLFLAHLLQKYQILPNEKTDKHPLPLYATIPALKPKNGVYMKLERC